MEGERSGTVPHQVIIIRWQWQTSSRENFVFLWSRLVDGTKKPPVHMLLINLMSGAALKMKPAPKTPVAHTYVCMHVHARTYGCVARTHAPTALNGQLLVDKTNVFFSPSCSQSNCATYITQYLFPFFGGPIIDGIAAIVRLFNRFIIPLVEAGKDVKAEDPRNWSPVHNPLLDQQAKITFAYDDLIAAHKQQTAGTIQIMRNMTWTILQSAAGRKLVVASAETGNGPEGVLRGNSVFNMYCSINPSQPSDLFSLYNTTIFYNALKSLMPVRYRVCAENRPVCEKAPMQACRRDSSEHQKYDCYNTNVCFGKPITNRLWPEANTAYDKAAPYTAIPSKGESTGGTTSMVPTCMHASAFASKVCALGVYLSEVEYMYVRVCINTYLRKCWCMRLRYCTILCNNQLCN